MNRARPVALAIAALCAGMPWPARASAGPPVAEPPGPRTGDTTTAPPPEPATDLVVPQIEPSDDGLGWDDPPAAQPTPPAPVPVDLPPPPLPTPGHRALERTGTGLLIGAGVVGLAASVLNGVRAYIVSVPCQTESQAGCTGSWMITTTLTWALNLTTIPLAATGGSFRGRYSATYDRERFERRSPRLVAAGAVMVALGVITNFTLRSVWFYDYLHPEGREVFDFAYPGDAIAYYGGLQLSSSLISAGAGMLAYGAARPFAPRKVVRRMTFGLSPHSVQLGWRF